MSLKNRNVFTPEETIYRCLSKHPQGRRDDAMNKQDVCSTELRFQITDTKSATPPYPQDGKDTL
jgi:hypothetical protein